MTTTRRLYLLRHAQAQPSGPSDHRRPLDGQGEADARALGSVLAARRPALSQVAVSDSARTRGTWACLEAAGLAAPVAIEPSLYNGDEAAYREVAERAAAGDVMIVGHNPTIASLAASLARDGERLAREQLARSFPTCALAVLRFEASEGIGAAFLEELLVPPHRAR